MAQYISKSALVAEINKDVLLTEIEKSLKHYSTSEDLDYIKKELDKVVRIYKPNGDFGWGTLYNVATYFYELGIKAQKGE